MTEIRPILWENGSLKLLDQTQLPKSETVIEVTGYHGAISAIRDMQVRGAPAIGITAAYGVAMAARDIHADCHADFMTQLRGRCRRDRIGSPHCRQPPMGGAAHVGCCGS